MIDLKDKQYMESLGISEEKLNSELDFFKRGQQYVELLKAATPESGIVVLTKEEQESFLKKYESVAQFLDIVKFVPASGAATRMFKDLLALKSDLSLLDGDKSNYYKTFFNNLNKFPFYPLVNKGLEGRCEQLIKDEDYQTILSYIFDEMKLDKEPKAFIPFHNYDQGARIPIEEHIIEAIEYGVGENRKIKLHFTISKEHEDKFHELVGEVVKKYSDYKLYIDYSFQESSTNTVAVDMDNNPFRDSEGNILFRAGGHGALIENLNNLDGDIIFVKNIDNIVHDNYKSETYRFKKIIGGVLIELKEEINYLLKSLEDESCDITPHIEFIEKHLGVDIREDDDQRNRVVALLNRPLRVCGMVANSGETGGGPFYIKDQNGNPSLQIIESAQIDRSIKSNDDMIKTSTHFNPVDIVYTRKDYEGHNFNLTNFVDHNQAFISNKSLDGKPLKALELPGLWNGAMAEWITIFVEVPLITFNPVKVVNDLLRDEHQG